MMMHTPRGRHPLPRATGFPAHAGMDPHSGIESPALSRLPRARGDGPSASSVICSRRWASPRTRGWTLGSDRVYPPQTGFPAHAGMDPRRPAEHQRSERLPRARGDGPVQGYARPGKQMASPRTRGWTLAGPLRRHGWRGFPAHAGMDPPNSKARTSDRGVHHQYPSAPEIKDLRTVHASGNERIFRLRSRS